MELQTGMRNGQATAPPPPDGAGEEGNQRSAHLEALTAERQRLDAEVRSIQPNASRLFGYVLAAALFLSSILWLLIVLESEANDESPFGAGLSLLVASLMGGIAAAVASRRESKKAKEQLQALQAAIEANQTQIDAASSACATAAHSDR